MNWIQTLRGRKFDLLNPDPDCIDPEELATVLSRICRFGGHCRDYYSVAQHSVLVCDLVFSPSLKLPALLHDAQEAYWGFGDAPSPVKFISEKLSAHLKLHKLNIGCAVADRFRINEELLYHEQVKSADLVALATEVRDLMATPPEPWPNLPDPSPVVTVEPLPEREAFTLFCDRLYSLWSDHR